MVHVVHLTFLAFVALAQLTVFTSCTFDVSTNQYGHHGLHVRVNEYLRRNFVERTYNVEKRKASIGSLEDEASDMERTYWVSPCFLRASAHSSSYLKDKRAALEHVSSLTRKVNQLGPWTVARKNATLVPNGDAHEYVTFARYYWPKNSTNDSSIPSYCNDPFSADKDLLLVWRTCPYEGRDGESVPDRDYFGDSEAFKNFAFTSLMNAVLYIFTANERYVKTFFANLKVWFIDPDTAIRPDVKYGQIIRGPKANNSDNDWSTGTFRGLNDWRRLVKIANSVELVRSVQRRPEWSSSHEASLRTWARHYYEWISNDPISLRAKNATNNIMSFWYAHAIAVNILMSDYDGARSMVQEYFQGPFRRLIDARGDQPQESNRTRALHYRAYGLEAMIVNAHMGAWLGVDVWKAKSSNDTTINDAIRYAVSLQQNSTSEELSELAPHVATALAVYGDPPDGIYSTFMANDALTGDPDHVKIWRLFNVQGAYAVSS